MISDMAIANALTPKVLNLILFPTEKCNFRCTYCYEDFVIGRMKKTVVDGVKKLIAVRVRELDNLSISWFGGEPLVARQIVEDIGSFAYERCKETNVKFSAGFTTNGYLLTPELLRRLVSINHTGYQISLDGDEEWHNKTRLLANKKGTFEKIWGHLLGYRAVAGNFDITLRLHVHGENVQSVKNLYKKIKSNFSSDSHFSIYFHKVSDLNPDNSINEHVLNREDYLSALSYITDTYPIDQNDLHSEEHLSNYICYAAKPNSLIVRANGRLGKCTVALADSRNDIGHINEDGTLSLDNEKLQKWFSGFGTLSEATLGCPLSTLR